MPRRVDELDRRVVAALQREPRGTWRAIARHVGVSEATVARRARRLLDTGVVRVIGSPVPTRLDLGFHVLVGFRCRAGDTLDVARQVAARADVRFVAIVTGTFDIVAEFLVQSKRQLAFVLLEEVQPMPGVVETSTNTVLRTYKVQETWSSVLLGEDAPPPPRRVEWPDLDEEAVAAPEPLGSLDLALLQLVSQDGRRSNADLAAEVGISESAVSRRLGALVRGGYVVFVALVDPAALGFEVETLVWITAKARGVEDAAHYLATQAGVRYVSVTSGYSDLVCEVVLPSQSDLLAFTVSVLGGHSAIRGFSISHELVTLKRGYLQYPAGFREAPVLS
jgi:DNA-binding Lrp family transcriptional regulator